MIDTKYIKIINSVNKDQDNYPRICKSQSEWGNHGRHVWCQGNCQNQEHQARHEHLNKECVKVNFSKFFFVTLGFFLHQ